MERIEHTVGLQNSQVAVVLLISGIQPLDGMFPIAELCVSLRDPVRRNIFRFGVPLRQRNFESFIGLVSIRCLSVLPSRYSITMWR